MSVHLEAKALNSISIIEPYHCLSSSHKEPQTQLTIPPLSISTILPSSLDVATFKLFSLFSLLI